MKRYALYIGRFQPWHAGHAWCVDQKLRQGVPVLIGVRPMPADEDNPYTTAEVCAKISKFYGERGDVKVLVLPYDIESINYGRGVGYEINEWVPPPVIAEISASMIRAAEKK